MLEVEVERLPLLELADIPARYTLFEKPNDFSIRFSADGTGSSEAYDETVPYDTYPFQWILRDDYVVQMSYFWDEIEEVRAGEVFGIHAASLLNTRTGKQIGFYLLSDDKPALAAALRQHTPENHPLRRYVEKYLT